MFGIIIVIFLFIYMIRFSIMRNTIIDIVGNNNMWKASLNMQIGYNNELVITLTTEKFEPPSEIFVDILVKDKSVYTDKLEIEDNNFSQFGIYKCNFNSIKYLEKNYKDVSVTVSVNDELITIPLNSIKTN